MARMFNANFDYNKQTYTATVVISGHDDEKVLSIKLPEELEDLVPEGKIVIERYNESQPPLHIPTTDPVLMESILEAVEKHEEAAPPLNGLWS